MRIAGDARPSRQRFTALHELGHKYIDADDDVNNWLWDLGGAQDHATEALADAFAAEILLPEHIVGSALSTQFGGRHVADLAAEATASREAVVVRAAQHLNGPGLVALALGRTVVFSAVRSLPFRIGRGVEQREGSVFDRAAANGRAEATRERVTLRSGTSYTDLDGDGHLALDGYTYVVMRESAADVDRHGNPWGGRTWECSTCGDDISDGDWCDTCNRRRCPQCGCRCGAPSPVARRPVCPVHYIELPASGICDFCQ